MALATYSVIRRHMKHSSAFTVYAGTAPPLTELLLNPGEFIVGWYKNPPPWEISWIVFTSEAFYIVEGDRVIDRLPYEDVVAHESPVSKTDATGVTVQMRRGSRFVRVAGFRGPHGKFKDVFNFLMVLMALEANNNLPKR